jgi:general secretion pathway protein A
MNRKKLLALFGLKWNPFTPDIPVQALWRSPEIDHFLFRSQHLVMEGGFALITGEPGLGKSKCLQLLACQLEQLTDIVVGVMQRPQSKLADFYREMGQLFGVNLSPANRYGGFKSLRQRWHEHIRSTLYRPVLLIDEAQEMATDCLKELRLLGSDQFDSQCLLTTVFASDMQLPHRFRHPDLVSLGSRMRVRLTLQPYDKSDLLQYLEHCLEQAGVPDLMTDKLKHSLLEHSCGNLRLLNTMAAELLDQAAHQQLQHLDEQLFIQTFSPQKSSHNHRKPAKHQNE